MGSRTLVEFHESRFGPLLSVVQVPANIFQLQLTPVVSSRTAPPNVVLRSLDVSSLPQCRIGNRLLTFLGRLDGWKKALFNSYHFLYNSCEPGLLRGFLPAESNLPCALVALKTRMQFSAIWFKRRYSRLTPKSPLAVLVGISAF